MHFFHYQFVLHYFDICGSFSNNTESTYSHRTTRLSPNAQLSVLPLYFAAGLSPSWGNQLNLLSSKMYPKWPLILGFHLFGKINFLSESELCWRIQFWAQSPPVSSPTSWNPFQHSEVQWVVKMFFFIINVIHLVAFCVFMCCALRPSVFSLFHIFVSECLCLLGCLRR